MRQKDEDSDLVYIFRDAIESKAPIRSRLSNGTKQVHLEIWNRKMADDLLRLGVVPDRANLNTSPPNLLPDLQLAFWRGCLDGDGHIMQDKRRQFFLSGWEIGLCGNHATVQYFKDFIAVQLGYDDLQLRPNGISRVCFVVRISGPRALEVMKLIYGWNANFGMSRKRDLAQGLVCLYAECLKAGLLVAHTGNGVRFANIHPSILPSAVSELVRTHVSDGAGI